jgi:hypothetical protein
VKQTGSSLFLARITLFALLLFMVLFVFFLYTFLHEAGHALTGLVFGQELTEFNVNFWDLSAHVGMAGGLSQSQRATQSAAGAGLPLLVWLGFISLVPRKATFCVETLKFTASMAVVNTLLVWIILPVLYLLGQAPSDDVTYFLRYSQIPPLLLSGLAAALYVAGWILFLSRIDGLRNEFLMFKRVRPETLTAGTHVSIPVMVSVLILCVVLTLTAGSVAAKNPVGRLAPPQDFQSVAQIDLSSQPHSNETLVQFSLDKSAYVGVYVAIRDINTAYFDLSITGPADYRSVILHGEGYRADQDGGLWEQNLTPGDYQLVLTSAQSPGAVSVYLSDR